MIFELVARFRTWIFNLILVVAVMAPEILNAPEILAIVPPQFQRYFLAFLFILNIWMRPRPAVLAKDVDPPD
jgi:hypothetical protein